MSGAIDIDTQYSPLSFPAAEISVFRDDGGTFTLLPNIVCEQIERQIGATPSTARFRYVLDHSIAVEDNPYPTQFEQVWPVSADGDYVVKADDRVVVTTWTDQGDRMFLFDGFAQVPQANVSPETQTVSFTAVGVEAREWDLPIGGRTQRDADDPEAGDEHQTDIETRFNPSDGKGGIRPNCTPDDFDVNQSDTDARYPVFLDDGIERDPDPRTSWTAAKAVSYILAVHNDETYVTNPLFSDLRAKLMVRRPNDDDGTIDPADAATFEEADVPLRDFDASNMPWPEAVNKLIGPLGYGMAFEIGADSTGSPVTDLIIDRFDTGGVFGGKTIRLDSFRTGIDSSASNVSSIAMARDVNGIVNAWSVETPLVRHEISVILAPGYTPSAGDATGTNKLPFQKSRLAEATALVQRKYRWYVADECGDGHWNGSSFVTEQPIDLSPIFPDEDDGSRSYCVRYREGRTRLISLDSLEKPRKAVLHYSTDYAGTYPALWDGTGTWKEVPDSTWKLLDGRLGIECTVPDPENWSTGKGKPDIKGITWPASGTLVRFRLTTVIEDDIMLPAVVGKRISSPTQFLRRRRVDAKDHYVKEVISPKSLYNQTNDEVIQRDDTEKALDIARQYRVAHEMGKLSGSVSIPYLTDYYRLFDHIKKIEGREVSLRGNIGSDQGEGPRFPYVFKIAWNFAGERQQTVLHLTDLRGEAPRA